ncbi:MAG TPA: hypothetical protein P5056_00015 [Candidatus Paceibacterota bacterium]|nr:hypothetical protein [Candidatus Paceibacterota bacterium]
MSKQEKYLKREFVEYYERNGRRWYFYEEGRRPGERLYSVITGPIPLRVIRSGENAIRRYSERMVELRMKSKKKKLAKEHAFALNPNFPISTMCGDVLLKGRIIGAFYNDLVVRLDSPYIGEAGMHYGMFAAMAGIYIFERGKRSVFTKHALETAKNLLVQIYSQKVSPRKGGNVR